MQKVFNFLETIISQIVSICNKILRLIVPVTCVLVSSDVLLGTKFSIVQRIVSILNQVGIRGNGVTILAIVTLVLWYSERKKN